jgi:Nanos RNA binding domain
MNSAIKPQCKVCLDAGFTERATQHWVKNREGKVICPTLLSQKCRYCFENGHTVNYCPKNKKCKAYRPPPSPKKTVKPQTQVKASKETVTPANRFNVLVLDEDEDMTFVLKKDVEEPFPQLLSKTTLNSTKTTTSTTVSYASKLQTPVPTPAPTQTPAQVLTPAPAPVTTPTKTVFRSYPYKRHKNWADYSDSDSDEDA